MKLIIFTVFLISFHNFAQKTANCADYDNKRIRCLAKKRCLWKDAGGSSGNGFCTFKPTEENQAEMQLHEAGQKVKMKCLTEAQNLKELDDGLTRATIYQDSAAIENLKDKIVQKAEELAKIPNCDYKSLIKIESSTAQLINVKTPTSTEIKPAPQEVEEITESEDSEDSEE